MRILGLFFLSMSLPLYAATTITSQIHDVDHGNQMGDEVLVFLTSGNVVKVSPSNLGMLETFQDSKGSDNWFTFTIDDKRYIKKMKEVESPYKSLPANDQKMLQIDIDPYEQPYTPTTLPSMQKAKQYIAESRHPITTRVTQCFNRAMIWTYEWWKKHSMRSQKVFVFWPKAYVRKYGHEWWFHVAPYAHVMDTDGVVKERVMDVKWISYPIEFQKWHDYHAPKDVKCRVVEKYSDFANYPWDADRCYFIRTHMYTWQPQDLELYESWDTYTKRAFNMDEVRSAYLEAFEVTI